MAVSTFIVPQMSAVEAPQRPHIHMQSKQVETPVAQHQAAGAATVAVVASAASAWVARSRTKRRGAEAGRASVVATNAFESELGVQAPVGFWDPLGLSADGDVTAFTRRRETELKHGRLSMLATMGYITPEFFKWPGYLSPGSGVKFADVPNGLGALAKVPFAGWIQIIIYCACVEVSGIQKRGTAPGDFGWKVLTSEDPEELKKKLAAEIANGRLAMMAIIGMFFQDGLTGSAWGDWANYTDSPLRAFESELGVQEPVGFWDPLGLAADGDLEAFKRRRETEIKHGRISMLATMGYITPELTGKFPGYLSPSAELKFQDIPNGLGALSKVPALGWGQMLLYCACVEAAGASNRGPGAGEFNWKVLTSSDPEEKKKKLAAEIANGRLAMMAIIGMFFQDGLTGSAWGDWANYTGSPLRVAPERCSRIARRFGGEGATAAPPKPKFDPETELGVQDPVGFWDPLGFSEDKDEAAFKRRRSIELKHGRICMLATIGYIVPEYFRFPGFLSPSQGIKFADVPNGLAALSKVPGFGWVQIVFFAGVIEGNFEFSGKTGGPGEFGWKVITSDDPEEKKKKLSAEIANGRLAMMAIMGMLFQDGLTGSAWGDWALYTGSPLRAVKTELNA